MSAITNAVGLDASNLTNDELDEFVKGMYEKVKHSAETTTVPEDWKPLLKLFNQNKRADQMFHVIGHAIVELGQKHDCTFSQIGAEVATIFGYELSKFMVEKAARPTQPVS